MPKPRPITAVKNFGGRRLGEGEVPSAMQDWALWCCDPTKEGKPSRGFAYGKSFPWHFDKEEKAFVLQGEATLSPDDPALHGEPVRIVPRDLVTFPRGWRGRWEIHSYLRKRYAFFDGKGLRIDEESDDDDDDDEKKEEKEEEGAGGVADETRGGAGGHEARAAGSKARRARRATTKKVVNGSARVIGGGVGGGKDDEEGIAPKSKRSRKR